MKYQRCYHLNRLALCFGYDKAKCNTINLFSKHLASLLGSGDIGLNTEISGSLMEMITITLIMSDYSFHTNEIFIRKNNNPMLYTRENISPLDVHLTVNYRYWPEVAQGMMWVGIWWASWMLLSSYGSDNPSNLLPGRLLIMQKPR